MQQGKQASHLGPQRSAIAGDPEGEGTRRLESPRFNPNGPPEPAHIEGAANEIGDLRALSHIFEPSPANGVTGRLFRPMNCPNTGATASAQRPQRGGAAVSTSLKTTRNRTTEELTMNPTTVRQLANAQLVALRAQAERDRTAQAARRARHRREHGRRHPGPRWSAAIHARLARREKQARDGSPPAQKTSTAATAPNRKAAPAPPRNDLGALLVTLKPSQRRGAKP
jgi:hypothetical protein